MVRNKVHYPWLDFLRFFAAFLVLLSHSRNDFFVRYDLLPINQQGWGAILFYTLGRLGYEAVIIFFVISGFLVGGKGLQRIFDGTFSIKDYSIDRLVRIGLPLIGAISFFLVTSLILKLHVNWITVLGNLFCLQGVLVDSLVTPFWSLSYEVWFYIILGVFSVMVLRRKQYALFLFVGCCVIFLFLKTHYLFIWIIGALAYVCRPTKRNKIVLLIALVGTLLSIFLLQISSASVSVDTIKLNREFLELILALFTCLLIQQIILFEPKNKKIVRIEKMFTYLASFSYTLYLSHRIIFLLLFRWFYNKNSAVLSVSDMLAYGIFLFLTMLGSFCLYLLFERNTVSVKTWIKKYLIN